MICLVVFAKKGNTFEDMRHLISCDELKLDINPIHNGISVEDMYGDLEAQVKFVKSFEILHTKRKLLEEIEA